MRGGGGQKMSVFVQAQAIKTVHKGGVKKRRQNSVHVVVECPLSPYLICLRCFDVFVLMQSMKTGISPDDILSKGNFVQWNCLEQFRIINRHIMPQTFIVYVHWRCMLWRRFFNASIYKKCWEAPLMWAELAGCSNCKLGALVKFQPHWAHNFPREHYEIANLIIQI